MPDEQVSVMVESVPPKVLAASPVDYIGAGTGLFASAQDVDRYLREQRGAWD